ncbi:FbpB family small basic protein [Mesobacillus zeae]|uniref:FbpB family small basic protein n=1 Tax=Mesobacillus zeae TaxID=1917180 RepID=A0A398BCC4_9BACI|nr:FbpB family small basic protein [Mesobacillus zeae]RID87482.1 FbpB family small basic protein [Mesobacillus zeae]
MKKKKTTITELTKICREELIQDKERIAAIERRIDERRCRTEK